MNTEQMFNDQSGHYYMAIISISCSTWQSAATAANTVGLSTLSVHMNAKWLSFRSTLKLDYHD